MIIHDNNNELITTKLKFFEGEIAKLTESWDACSTEMELLDCDDIPFSADRLNNLTMRMTSISTQLSSHKESVASIKKSISN